MNRLAVAVLAAVCLGLAPEIAHAEGAEAEIVALRDQVQALTQRLEQLEQGDHRAAAVADTRRHVAGGARGGLDWTERLSVSGNTDIGYVNGGKNSREPAGRFVLENARLFFDVDLTDYSDVEGGIAESTSFFVEWDMIRWGGIRNRFGSVYLQFEQLLDRDWLNLRLGRTPVPFGVEYERFHQARPENPLFSYSVTSPYNWDQGISLYGSFGENRLAYVVAVMNGDSRLENSHSEPAISTKLTVRPLPWMEITVSGLRSGKLGAQMDDGRAAFGFSGVYPTPFGARTSVPNYAEGGVIGDDPAGRVDVSAWELDWTLRSESLGHLWFSYGAYDIAANGAASYDRDLRYWVAEGVLELGAFADLVGWSGSAEILDDWYVAVRHSAVGTFDANEGYLLEFMNEGDNLGFNTERVLANSVGVGYRLNGWATLKLEYSHFDVDLIRGVPADLRRLAGSRDYMAVGVSAGF